MNIYSVIVCFNPDIANLLRLCESLLASKSKVVVVDNTESSYLSEHIVLPDCKLIALGMNAGIARAQNIGVRYATERGASVIVFFDQDSKIDRDFLPALTSPLMIGEAKIVAPTCVDNVRGFELPSTRLTRYGLPTATYSRNGGIPCPVDVVVSSGTAATKEVFDVGGLLDEDFFIDFVDTEWCLRCRSKGIPIHVVPSAVMRHAIGVASIQFGNTTLLVHNPTRCYYQIRNCFLLFRKTHIPFLFALRETVSVMSSRLLLLLFVKNRAAYIKAYGSALGDGLKGVVGKKPTLH